ncbi:Ig-like domain-containing protein, partial [Aporhodopirellula aestuarii]
MNPGTLRSAIIEANSASPASRTIILESGHYVIEIASVDDPASTFPYPDPKLYSAALANTSGWSNELTGDFDVTGNIAVVGDINDETIIDGNSLDRVFKLHPGARLDISRVTITGGVSPVDQGGGGILSAGTLTVRDSNIRGNVALGTSLYKAIRGGGIAAWEGSADILRTWIDDNEADYGGGVFYGAPASGSVLQSTISNNIGGGLHSHSENNILVSNSTFSANLGGQGAIYNGQRDGFGSTEAAIESESLSISGDGRYVAFVSRADELVPGDNNQNKDVYVFDRVTERFERITTSREGLDQPFPSYEVAISRNGRFVAFSAGGPAFVDNDRNEYIDVFVFDREEETFDRVSVSSNGSESNGQSGSPTISEDGRFVAFDSDASNLVSGDNNGVRDIFLFDRQARTIERISNGLGGTESDGHSTNPFISADGTHVVYQSLASNIVHNDTNNTGDVFVFDRLSRLNDRVSVSSSGVEANGTSGFSGNSKSDISDDGTWVVFQSNASNLVSGDSNGSSDVFLHNTVTDATTLVSRSQSGNIGNDVSYSPSISGDGERVSFVSRANNLVTGDLNRVDDVFLFNRTQGTTTLVSKAENGLQSNGFSLSPSISSDGTAIAFISEGNNLVSARKAITGYSRQLFISETTDNKTTSPTIQSPINSSLQASQVTVAMTDGAQHSIAGAAEVTDTLFSMNSGPLEPLITPVTNSILSSVENSDKIGKLTRIGNSPPVHPLLSQNPAIDAGSAIYSGTIDQRGVIRKIPDVGAYESVAASIAGQVFVDLDRDQIRSEIETLANGFEVIVRDRFSGKPVASHTSGGVDVFNSSPSGSGLFLISDLDAGYYDVEVKLKPNWSFSFPENRLVPGEESGVSDDEGKFFAYVSNNQVYLFNKEAQQSILASPSLTGGLSNGTKRSLKISGNGEVVVFLSSSTDLVAGDTNGHEDAFAFDIKTGTVERISRGNNGIQASWPTRSIDVNYDGRLVAFTTEFSFGHTGYQTYVRDRLAQTTEIVSVNDSGVPAVGNYSQSGNSVSISSDGRYVAFSSRSSNLVPGDTNGNGSGQDIFVFDRQERLIERVSVANGGEQVDSFPNDRSGQQSYSPVISGDGQTVVFESYASDLVPNDTNNKPDLFAFDLASHSIQRLNVSNDGLESFSIGFSSFSHSVSDDGRFIVFHTGVANLVSDDSGIANDVFVVDRLNSKIARVSLGFDGGELRVDSTFPRLSADGRLISFKTSSRSVIPNDTTIGTQTYEVANPFATPGRSTRLAFGDIVTGFDLPILPDPGKIDGRIFVDNLVPNGQYDAGEFGLSNVLVYLDANRNSAFDFGERATLTTTDGTFVFLDVPAELEYLVSVVAPSGYEYSLDRSQGIAQKVFLQAGGSITDRAFAFNQVNSTGQSSASAVRGRLFDDKNANGVFDSEIDTPLVNKEVYLDASNFGIRDANEPRELTDANGMYSFTGLSSRNVAVSTTLDSTLVHVTPLGSDFQLAQYPLFPTVQPFGNPQSIGSGDFNGDGFLDVAVALGEGNKLSIRLNDGSGGFLPDQINVDLGQSGSGPTSLVVGQFDDDSKLDVALTANFAGNVTVLLNFDPVTKSFGSTTYVKVGDEPLDIAAGQFGGDAKPDLVVVNKVGNTVQLLTNNGSGVFTAGTAVLSGGKGSSSIVVGRFSGDALDDVAVIHSSPKDTTSPFGGVTVLAGNGVGGLALQPSYYQVGALPIDSVTADFNKDGRADLAVANFSSNSISVLLGQADGSFKVQTAILGTASGAFDIAFGDVDNDGDVDLIASNLRDRNISIFRNDGPDATGDVQFQPLENIGLGQFSLAQRMPLVVANFDNDTSGPGGTGTIDIVTIPQKSDTLHVLKNRLVNGSRRVALTGLNVVTGVDFIIKPAILPPSFNVIGNPLDIFEDSAQQSITISGITKGRTTGPALQFSATSSNPSVISTASVTYAGASTGTVNYTPVADKSGSSVITVRAVDAGADGLFGGADDGIFERSFTVTVLAVNDPPVFNLLAEASAKQTDGVTTVLNFVTGVGNGGGADESSQTRNPLVVTATDTSFFTTQPAINAAGTLTFTPNPNKSGSVPVTVTLKDSGGRANGGVDTTTKTFLVNVLPVNDPPSFALIANPNRSVLQTAGPQTFNNFVASFSPGGGPDESTQTVSDYIITVDAPGIFSVFPDIDNNGTLTFTPATDRTGVATVSVRVRDTGGQANGGIDLSAAQSFTIAVTGAPDTLAPTPVITTPGISSLTNQKTFDVEVDFKEPLTAGTFTLADFTVTGASGRKSNLRDLGAGKYLIEYTSTSDGAVTFGVAASIATDLAGNPNLAAVSVARTIDSVGMTPTLDSTVALLSNAASFVVAIDFKEAATGFAITDLVVLNGTASNLQTVNATTGKYNVTITPEFDGNVTVLLPANAVTDAAGNGNLSALPLVRSFDRTAPVAVLSTDQPSTTNKTNFDVIVEFSETVSTPVKSNLIVSGGTASDPVLVSPRRYRYAITATGISVNMQFAANAVTDMAGNHNTASNSISLTIDSSTFVPALSSTSASELNTLSFPVAVDFGKSVAGFVLADVTVLNGTATNLAPVDAATGKYSLAITAPGDGDVSVLIAAGVVEDTGGNNNSASSTLVRTIDRTASRPTLTASVGTLTNQPVFTLTVDFGENVTGFTVTDVVASGATLSAPEILGNGR